jgi:hypothetical protein
MYESGNSPMRSLRKLPQRLALGFTLGLAAQARPGQLMAARTGAVEIPWMEV